ncbi:DUF402 domain-containing protein [Ureibacillus manganicus]|uniref:DUF402 domain-containing protein n=1 Tax=Ureibacillus manganicus DSM 26584 TaxID=1384049 RepID=A0A0A3HZJ3_9BACL|nr:DUF402 domain-containing protein [Ureibacillus manganicus]KGR78021.1 hypothetical protein CD29_12755 [Ureibacillus manganicus DSM 26584]
MLKRKYGDRPGWQRVDEKQYAQTYLETTEFKGYVTLVKTIKVSKPLFVNYGGTENVCIVGDGYSWLQHFPLNENYSVTTMFDPEGRIIQWYIDICKEIGVEDQIPWMDDLYLDLIVLPTGEIYEKDADELEDAYIKGWIDKPLYDLAWMELKKLKRLIEENQFQLIKLSKEHKEIVESQY